MRKIEDVIDVVRKTLEDKGNIYGPTYRRVATMLSVQPQYSIMVRILEKIARAHNLLRMNGSQEHLREEFVDIACYAILAAFESEVPELSIGVCSLCMGTGTVINAESKTFDKMICPACQVGIE